MKIIVNLRNDRRLTIEERAPDALRSEPYYIKLSCGTGSEEAAYATKADLLSLQNLLAAFLIEE